MKTAFGFELKLPKLKPFGWKWNVNRGRPMSKYHYWEVNFNNVSLADVERVVSKAGLQQVRRDEAHERIFFAYQAPPK